MNSEKVKDLKKGLEFNAGIEHHDKLSYIDGYTPKQIAYKEIFNYINELESENGELKQHITEVEKGIINISRERNKKEELASKFIDSYNDSLKQFAERLKEISCEMYLKEQLHRCIDETLKEFIKE